MDHGIALRQVHRDMASGRRDQAAPHLAAFGRRVRELRLAAGLTQEALAHMAELQPAAVSLIESGQRDVQMSALWMLAGALGVPATRLIEPAADTPEPDVPV